MNRLFKTITNSQDQNSVIPLRQHKDIEHKIVIEELEIEMSVGILPEEKETKQRVLVSVDINLTPKATYNDNIDDTVSYASIIERIEELSNSKHFNLVETLAEEISQECFNYASVTKVTTTIKKPDIIKNVKSVGFSITRTKN